MRDIEKSMRKQVIGGGFGACCFNKPDVFAKENKFWAKSPRVHFSN